MAYTSNLAFELRGMQAGQTVVTQLEYHSEVNAAGLTAVAVANAVNSVIWAAINPLVTNRYTLIEIRSRAIQVGANPVDDSYIFTVNEPGALDEETLPPNVTAVIRKNVDNTTRLPIGAAEFRNGFVGFSGIPESVQENGLLTTAAINDWLAVANAIESITLNIGGTNYTWTLGLERGEINPDKVLVASCTVKQKLGTRNSRKR